MRAVKVYNNNAVSTVTSDGREAVVIGSGVGFSKRPGDKIEENRIEKIYYIQNDLQTRFLQLLNDTRPEALEAAERILEYARTCGLELKNQMILSLTDHISFAIERYEQGIEMPNLMMTETKMLYRKEYEIGQWALVEVERVCGIKLPEYEASYIALQLASSTMNRDMTYNTLKLVKGAMDVIRDTYGVDLDPDQIDTMRLTTHLKFLAQRIISQTQWEDGGVDGLYRLLVLKHHKHQECIDRLKAYIQSAFHYTLNAQEEVYLLVHLSKIFHK